MQLDFLADSVVFCFYVGCHPSFGCAQKERVST